MSLKNNTNKNRLKNDLIISIEEDEIYPFDFVENIIKNFIIFGANKKISFDSEYSDWIKNKTRIFSLFGACSIIKYEFFKEKKMKL